MTPHSYILHLITYVTDDAMIAAQCNREFGTKVTKQRVSEIRRKQPKREPRWVEPYHDNEFARRKLNAIKGNEKFLEALGR